AVRTPIRLVRAMALPDEGELGEADRVVSPPGPDERRVLRRGVGADLDVVLGVGLERCAAEEREPREIARQRAPGRFLFVGRLGKLHPPVHGARHVIAPGQRVVLHGGGDGGGRDLAVEPRRRAAKQIDLVVELDRQAALNRGADLIGERLFQLERNQDLTVARQRRDLQRLVRGLRGERCRRGKRQERNKIEENSTDHYGRLPIIYPFAL